MMIKKIKLVSVVILAVFIFSMPVSVFALDINFEYPSILWGTTAVTDGANNRSFYSQTEGNVVVRNIAASQTDNLAFGVFCTVMGVARPCFKYLNEQNLKVLNAGTYVNGFLKNTLAVLYPAGINVFGASNNSAGSFNYWGKHLRQTSDNSNSNAFWQSKNYQFNPSAQAFWNSGNNATMNDTISRLMQNSRVLPNNLMTGSFDGICYSVSASINSCPEINQYSDGRVWNFNAPLTVSGLSYQKKATVIAKNGDLTLDGSVNSILSSDQSSSIGFVVLGGNVLISNPNNARKTIRASIFAPNGNIIISGSNIDFIGSFVANDFSVAASSNNINFIADTRGENVWPPGFRDLQPFSTFSK